MSSSGAPEAAATALVVPVDVVALCVGTADEQEATSGFAGATAVYTEQYVPDHNAFLGSNVTRGFAEPPWDQLTTGIHLHWALPDALTHADASDGKLDFPAAPNRWLVTRLVISGSTPSTSSWLLESDALAGDLPKDGQLSVTVPVAKSDAFPNAFAYLGRAHELHDAWTMEAVAPAPLLREAGHGELNAVTNGEAGFAAYYPSAGGVFGFYDALAGVTPPASDPARVMYAIVGWYDTAANDPVQPGATAATLEKAYGWTYAGDASPSSSVYSGVVEGIAWSPQTKYVLDQPVQGPIQAKAAAIGGDSAQALAAHFANLDAPGPGSALYEQILYGFQRGLLSDFKQPKPGQLAQLDEDLHDGAFATSRAGRIYAIVKEGAGGGGHAKGEGDEVIDLPLPLADALNELNLVQEQYDLCSAHTRWFRWQLFADWYRIFMADADTQNAAFQAAYQRYGDWDGLQTEWGALRDALTKRIAAVKAQLGPGLILKKLPAQRYEQPADPVVMLTGDGLEFPTRHGGDGRYDAQGYMICRTSDQLLTAESVSGHAIAASSFTGVTAPAGLPADSDLCTALLREACLLSTDIAAAISGTSAADLETALATALAGGTQSVYTFTGIAPSPVAVNWWEMGQWLPLFVSWHVDFLPLQPTADKTGPLSYTPQFFESNFRIDPNTGGAIAYAPEGQFGITVDPSSATFSQYYDGDAHLTPTAANLLERLLAEYLKSHKDKTLEAIETQLQSADFVTAPLSGLTDLLLMRRHGVQLDVKSSDPNYGDFTDTVRPVVGGHNDVGPAFDGFFNPIRAGWMKVSLQLVDAFGQKREVKFPELVCAQPMKTVVGGAEVKSVAYLEPRLAQPSRLLFRWLSADSTGYEEMNSHPATSPICGWLLPDRVDGSLFLYSQEGRPLGTLFLEQGGTADVGWQSAPGDDATIDEDVATALAYENPQLLALAVALKGASTEFFTDFWRAIDTVGDTVNPGAVPTNAGMALLVGRPVALTQASLRLELQGRPALDLGWDVYTDADGFTDTDDGTSDVEFPVVLGDLTDLSDGLVGFFKEASGGTSYDLSTFFTEGAQEGSKAGVVRPAQDTLSLTATPEVGDPEPPDLGPRTQKVLMLADPQAEVHATSGILPTASLQIPPDMSSDALSTLDMSFFTSPVLKGASSLALPTPKEAGYQLSWIEQVRSDQGVLEWSVTPEVDPPPSGAVWAYTPQTVAEGWLRLNPMLLDFELLSSAGKPVVTGGAANALTLHVTNRARRSITFLGGAPVAEGTPPAGSVFYVHFGALVAAEDVPKVQLSAPGWTFQLFTSTQYGPYWAAAPALATTLGEGAELAVAVANLTAAKGAPQAQVYFDYYHLEGLNDGVSVETVAVQSGS